jgi:hypothetical protein
MSMSRPRLLGGARPLFLIGCPRSGTTFTANLLNAHPEVLMTSETAAFMLADHVIKGAESGIKAGINYGKQYHKLLAGMLAEHYRSLLEAFYERIAQEQGRSYLSFWGEKHPHMHECLDRVDVAFPDACYVYIVRDPRDSACSIADMINVPYMHALENWKVFSDAYEKFVSGLAPERVLTVRYEDMVENYYAAAKQIFNWLGLPVAANVLEFVHASKGTDAHAINVRKDFASSSKGRWQGRISEEDLAGTKRLVGAFMERYQYGD